MKRSCTIFLEKWLKSSDRKPLVIRGARQVGKTWIVRNLAEINKKKLIEINLEKKPEAITLFESNNPEQILVNLSASFGKIDKKNAILFLDEIQAAPELLSKLRWFAEDMPELPVIAAGSLLEFVLADHLFSMPVGRINYLYLEPMSFMEFLEAKDKNRLVDYIEKFSLYISIPIAIHNELMNLFKEYIIIGGMPQAVKSWISNNSLEDVSQIHNDILATYRDDFNKYNGRLSVDRINETMVSVPFFLGQKFMYSKVNPDVQTNSIKQALDLLSKARICHKVYGSAGNGVPLGAEIQEKYLKVIFLDVGLCSAQLGLSLDKLIGVSDLDLVNKGGISEQVAGQLLRTIFPFYLDPVLFYWHRSEKSSNAEIDYLMQYKGRVLPIEIKSGSSGGLKSLHLFMKLKKLDLAARINSDLPSKVDIEVKDYEGDVIKYKLISIPYYLISRLHNVLD